MSEQSPFQSGVRVAIVARGVWARGATYQESRVLKVHKTGNFTLERDPKQQWRPWLDRGFMEPRWTAYGAGRSRPSGEKVYVWDAAMDEEVAAATAQEDRAGRWRRARDRIERIRPERATDDLVSAVEAALSAFEAPTPPTGSEPAERGA